MRALTLGRFSKLGYSAPAIAIIQNDTLWESYWSDLSNDALFGTDILLGAE